ncbi:MAG: hypothetical protein UX97_C0013G0019 [Candidatus Beckwithbacteria bacterium GW2011_GWA2_47_25]|nr:MAG: hypothetical protein UX97_C0013G0019 [Candidatus Beckwithbacteria bacterium GW2011_GWA2_47_25]
MIAQTTITPRYQLHIPVSIRKAVGLTRHGRTVIRADGNKIIIEPVKESAILMLAGSLKDKKPTKKINIDKIRDYIDYSRA